MSAGQIVSINHRLSVPIAVVVLATTFLLGPLQVPPRCRSSAEPARLAPPSPRIPCLPHPAAT